MTLDADTDELREKGKLTFSKISAGMESRHVPMVSQILRIINDISGRADSLSVNDLAEFISGEPTTLGRILSIARSIGYNSGGIEISSVHHAISVIGFDRIRTLAVSVLLFESAQSDYMAEANRELAGEALVSGLVAAEICRRGVSADPEVAFICGVMREYGRMLAATFLPKDYAEAVCLGRRDGHDEAFRAVFGISSLELGRQLLEGMKVPQMILNSFVILPPQSRRRTPANPTVALVAASDFGLRVARLIQSPDLTSGNFEGRLESLSREYAPAFLLTGTDAREMLDHLIGVIGCLRCRAGSYVGSVEVFRRLDCLACQRALPPSVVAALVPATRGSRSVAEVTEPGTYEI